MTLSLFSIFILVTFSLFFAASDFARKKAAEFCSPVMMLAIVFSSVLPIYLTIFLLADDYSFSSEYIIPGLGSVATNIIANLLFIRSVFISPLSKTIPLLSITPVFAAMISLVFLNEALLIQQWIGILLVVMGILWLYVPEGNSFNFMAIIKNLRQEKGAKYMFIVGLCWTLSSIFDRVALQYTTVPTHAVIHFSIASVFLWAWIFLFGGFKKYPLPKKEGWIIISILSLSYGAGMVLQMLALKMVYVGIVESVKRVIGQISAVIVGRIAFNEPITKTKIFGIITMAIGVPLIIIT